MDSQYHNLFLHQDLYLLDCLAREESPRTVEGKKSCLNLFFKWCFTEGITDISLIDDLLLERYRVFLWQFRFGDNQSLDITTRRNRLSAVRVFIRRLFELRKLEVDGTARFRLPKKPRKLPKGVLNDDELGGVLAQALLHGKFPERDRAIFETFYASALRRMELANLRIEDVDTQRGIVRVEQGKGRKDRYVPIAPGACEWINTYIAGERKKQRHFKSGKHLFLNNSGEKFAVRQLSRLVRSYLSRAGIDKPGACNVFRHTSATHMLEGGADIRVIQDFLGHADISTTQIYAHVSIRKLEEDYRKTHPAYLNYESPNDVLH